MLFNQIGDKKPCCSIKLMMEVLGGSNLEEEREGNGWSLGLDDKRVIKLLPRYFVLIFV